MLFLVLVLFLSVINSLHSASIQQSTSAPEESKIFVGPNFDSITTQRNKIKPTSHIVSHKPGIPPGWDKIPARPVIIGGLFSFKKLQRESNLVEIHTEFPHHLKHIFQTHPPDESPLFDDHPDHHEHILVAHHPEDHHEGILDTQYPDELDHHHQHVANVPNVVTELTITSDLNLKKTSNKNSSYKKLGEGVGSVTINKLFKETEIENEVGDSLPSDKSSFGLSRPVPVGPPEATIFQNSDNGQNNGVLTWVLNTLGINRPIPPPQSPSPTPTNTNTNKPPVQATEKPTAPIMRACKSCVCGETFKQTRIVGGVETEVNAYPWVVYLKYKNNFYCGGSLISDLYVLTAGHCVSFPKDMITVTLLDHDRVSTSETKTITRKVANIYKHKNYNLGGSYNNDIALLKLSAPLTFEGRLHPVCLPPIGPNFNNDLGVAVGWGATKEGGHVSNVLREVAVPIMSNEECRKSNYGSKITDNMMCAGDVANGGIDSCQGDSGGPLHVVKNGKNLIAGIVSWGEGCAQKNYPGVYTRVNRYISWIMTNTKDSCYCQNTL